MTLELSPIEARILGCLLEKSVVTPDQYPLTLNSLTNACNQKSAREPVMNLEQGEVQRGLRQLQDKRLVVVEENFKTRVEKYSHRFCNTPFSDFQFEPAEYAIVCVMLLRGPRTPGELRANVGRLHTFSDNSAVEEALGVLQAQSVVQELPRTPGRRDNEYMHAFFGNAHLEELAHARQSAGSDVQARQVQQPQTTSEPLRDRQRDAAGVERPVADHETPMLAALENRVAALERQVSELLQMLKN